MLLVQDVAHSMDDDVDINTKSNSSRTPGTRGFGAPRDDVDFNTDDSNGLTPLSCAAGSGHEGVVGCLHWIPIQRTQTPLSFAALCGRPGKLDTFLANPGPLMPPLSLYTLVPSIQVHPHAD